MTNFTASVKIVTISIVMAKKLAYSAVTKPFKPTCSLDSGFTMQVGIQFSLFISSTYFLVVYCVCFSSFFKFVSTSDGE